MNIHILGKYSIKIKAAADFPFSHYGREQRKKHVQRVRTSASQKTSWHSDKRKCMSFLSQTWVKSVAMKEFLKPLWLSQLFPKPRAEGPWWANPLSDRESKRKRKGKQGLGGRRGSERKADDISNLYPLQYQRNYKVLRAYKTLQMMSALNCVNTDCGVTASHTSGGHTHDSHGHKTATSSEHAEKREEENEIITEKTGIYAHSSNAVAVGLCTVVCFCAVNMQ